MMYRVADIDDMRHDGRAAGESDRDRIETALNDYAGRGLRLVGIVPQYSTWDEDGMPSGKGETLFIFQQED